MHCRKIDEKFRLLTLDQRKSSVVRTFIRFAASAGGLSRPIPLVNSLCVRARAIKMIELNPTQKEILRTSTLHTIADWWRAENAIARPVYNSFVQFTLSIALTHVSFALPSGERFIINMLITTRCLLHFFPQRFRLRVTSNWLAIRMTK